MKKVFSLSMVVLLFAALFAGCSGGGDDGGGEIKGETYDSGVISVLVPEGWMAVPAADVFDEYDGEFDPYWVHVGKGFESDLDLFSKPRVSVQWRMNSEPAIDMAKGFYDDVVDIDSVEIGSYTFSGFSGMSLSYPITDLYYYDGENTLNVQLLTENGGMTISLDDADVQAIIASIVATPPAE